jgi:hypothetical protein
VTTIEKVAMAIVGVALATTLVLPDRKTAQVITAGGNVFSNALKAAMGR